MIGKESPGVYDRYLGSYHNHTTWSDGEYEPEELVKKALKLHFHAIGITDHYVTYKGGIKYVGDDQILDYIKMIKELKNDYRDKIKVLGGLEIDTSRLNPYRDNLPYNKLNKLDYVLFEYVDEDIEESFSLKKVIKITKELKCPVGLAHSDLRLILKKHKAEDFTKSLGESKIFIDVCGSNRNIKEDQHNSRKLLYIEDLGMILKRKPESTMLNSSLHQIRIIMMIRKMPWKTQ